MSFNDEDEDVVGDSFGASDDLLDDDLDIPGEDKPLVDEEDGYDPEDRYH